MLNKMRIIGFHKFAQSSFEHHTLKNNMVVIDAQNFFYNTYKDSGLQFVFGCESDKYAQYLRNYLSMFKKANIKCYFIFNGGRENFESIKKETYVRGKEFAVGDQCADIIMPIAMKDVHTQVLNEMEFDYTICEFESKKECIALAKALHCAVISYDTEFCFAGVSYIPYPDLTFDVNTSEIKCKRFVLTNFLKIYQLTEAKLSIFIALAERNLSVQNYTDAFKATHKIWSYVKLLKWLSQLSTQTALDTVSNFMPPEFRIKFLQVVIEAGSFVRPKVTVGVPSLYLQNSDTFKVTQNDPLWFKKGIAAHHIARQYINLYHHASVFGSWSIQDKNSEDAMLMSIELIIYAYNLMKNYKYTEIKFVIHDEEPKVIMIEDSIPKPNYEAEVSVFENGWREIKSLGLFEHFLKNALAGFHYETLKNLPNDARLLMITMIYFTAKKSEDTTSIIYSNLLSYIALSVVSENTERNNKERDSGYILATTNKSDIFQEDITMAYGILQEYFAPVTAADAANIFDRKLNHALMEFQHCLDNFNFLNKLCGSPYKPTVYSKTLNGTFVYKILHEITNVHGGDGLSFVTTKLTPATSVLAFFKGLVNFYSNSIN